MIIDAHTHPFGPPSHRDLTAKIRTVADIVGFRTNHPDLYNTRFTESPTDFADELLNDMDEHGISRAVMEPDPCGMTNELVADCVARHPDRLIGLFRLEHDQSVQGYVDDPASVREAAPAKIAHCVKKLGLKGMGDVMVRAFTTEIHPEKIARDFQPIMDAIAEHSVFISFPTAWTQFPGQLYFADPIFLDEIAGRNPTVPIKLTKMGRGIDHYFESALLVAMRNANVYFDTVGTTPAHLKRAVDSIGARRIMFGTDWMPTWRCLREPADLYTTRLNVIRDAGLSEADKEQILWKTTTALMRL